MDEQTKEIFNKREVKASDTIDFYISEITKDQRIILTKENPEDKLNKIQNFIVNSKDKVLESSVAAIMNFGIIVNCEEIVGLIPISEFKRNKIMSNNFMIGEKINVVFNKLENDKIVFRLPE